MEWYIYVEWYKQHECMDIWMYKTMNLNSCKMDKWMNGITISMSSIMV